VEASTRSSYLSPSHFFVDRRSVFKMSDVSHSGGGEERTNKGGGGAEGDSSQWPFQMDDQAIEAGQALFTGRLSVTVAMAKMAAAVWAQP